MQRELAGFTWANGQSCARTHGHGHINSWKKYEAGQAQLSLDALRKIATTLHTSTDFLLFDEHERGPSDDLRLQFEVKALLDGMIIKDQTKQIVGNLSS